MTSSRIFFWAPEVWHLDADEQVVAFVGDLTAALGTA